MTPIPQTYVPFAASNNYDVCTTSLHPLPFYASSEGLSVFLDDRLQRTGEGAVFTGLRPEYPVLSRTAYRLPSNACLLRYDDSAAACATASSCVLCITCSLPSLAPDRLIRSAPGFF